MSGVPLRTAALICAEVMLASQIPAGLPPAIVTKRELQRAQVPRLTGGLRRRFQPERTSKASKIVALPNAQRPG
jgi:hypothetical protein